MFVGLQECQRARLDAGGQVARPAVEPAADLAAIGIGLIGTEKLRRVRDQTATVFLGRDCRNGR